MLKEKLQELTPNIVDQLPQGAIMKIAKKAKLARQSVTRMLKGEMGKDDNILELLRIVEEIAQEEGQKQSRLAESVSLIVNSLSIVAAG